MREMQDRMRALELRAQGIREEWQHGEQKGFVGQLPTSMSTPNMDVSAPQQAWGPEVLSVTSPPMGSPVSSTYPELISAMDERPIEHDSSAFLTPEVARFKRTHEQRLRHFREERSRDLATRLPATMLAARVDDPDMEDYEAEEYDANGAAISPRQRRARAMKHVLQSSDVHAWDDWEHSGGKALYDWSEQRVRTVGQRPDPSPVMITKTDWKEFEKPPRPFVPGGARARPIHAAMDEHYYRVEQKSPRSPKAKLRSRSTTPVMRRQVQASEKRSKTPPRAMDGSGRRQIDSRGNLVHEKGAGWKDPRHKGRAPVNRPPSKRRQQFMDNRAAAEAEAQKKWEKARAAEPPTMDRNRPFVPAGARSRPVHSALDVHAARKAQPFPEPKPHTEKSPAHRPQISSHRISPSRPNDPQFQASAFAYLLDEMKAPKRQTAPPSRRPFVPGGAQQRPVHQHMEEHMRKVQKNMPKADKRVRSALPTKASPFSPSHSPERDADGPMSPISPRSEMQTPGYEQSFDESYGGRYLVSARGDQRLRAEDKKRRERDQRIIEDLSRTIDYPGDVRPVASMLDQSFASVDSPHSFGGR
jgi:hypothetical protein